MDEIIISTEQNPQIKSFRALQQKKYREEKGKFIVEGVRFLEEALDNDCLEKVFISEAVGENQRIGTFLETCLANSIPTIKVTEKVFKTMTETVNSQGILGVGKQPNWNTEDLFQGGALILLVDGVQDPGNLGTIIRTCQGAGVSGLIVTKGTVDIYNPKVLRSTMGAIFKLPIIKWDDNSDLLQLILMKGFQFIAADLDTDINYYDVNLKEPTVIMVGNEANGPSPEILQRADIKAKLPMPGGQESLNVAVATGILLFEALRQRQFKR